MPLIGHAASISAGEYIHAVGVWLTDRTHGLQFKADLLKTTPPTTTEGMARYLGSGMVRGIGPKLAERIVGQFGLGTFEVIEADPTRLREVPGIGEFRAGRIAAGWAEQKAVRDIMVFLHSHGVSTSRAVRIFKTYGHDAIAVMTDDPYRLARDIRGIGFRSADAIAMRLGITKESQKRLRAGVSFALQTATDVGALCRSSNSCALPRSFSKCLATRSAPRSMPSSRAGASSSTGWAGQAGDCGKSPARARSPAHRVAVQAGRFCADGQVFDRSASRLPWLMQEVLACDAAQVEVGRGLDQDFGRDAGVAARQASGPEAELVEAGLQVGPEDEAGACLAAGGRGEGGPLRADDAVFEPGLEEAFWADHGGWAKGGAQVFAELEPAWLLHLQPPLELDARETGEADAAAREVVQRDRPTGVDEAADAVGRHFGELRGLAGHGVDHGGGAGLIARIRTRGCRNSAGSGSVAPLAVRCIEAAQDLVELALDPIELGGARRCRALRRLLGARRPDQRRDGERSGPEDRSKLAVRAI